MAKNEPVEWGPRVLLKSGRKSRNSVYDDIDMLDIPARSWISKYVPVACAALMVLTAIGFSSNLISRNADATANPEAVIEAAMVAPTTDLVTKGSLLASSLNLTDISFLALRRQTVSGDDKGDLAETAPLIAGVAAPIPRARPTNIAKIVAAQKIVKIIPASYQTGGDEEAAAPAIKRLLSTPAIPAGPLVLVAPVAQPKAQAAALSPQTEAPSAPKAAAQVLQQVRYKTAELTCLARAVYFEARSESELGQLAVAKVILNRVKDPDYPKTICGVVYQGSERRNSCQFSFACDGLANRVRSPESWARAKQIAERAVADDPSIRMLHATNYHADYVTPRWAKTLKRLVRIGHHIFYKTHAAG